jgi:hypothetical protein
LQATPSGGGATKAGSHVLTLVGTSQTQAIIAWLITA